MCRCHVILVTSLLQKSTCTKDTHTIVNILKTKSTLIIPMINYYKQKQGRIKSKGNKTGMINKLRPHVHMEPTRAVKMRHKMVKEKMKHPPR